MTTKAEKQPTIIMILTVQFKVNTFKVITETYQNIPVMMKQVIPLKKFLSEIAHEPFRLALTKMATAH
jgi:hypothetical protein